MQLTVSPATSAALQADGTIRCLADARYQPPAPPSRHSSVAFSLAKDLVNDFTAALSVHLDHHQATATNSEPQLLDINPGPATGKTIATAVQAQLYAVNLRHSRMLVLFDVLLPESPHYTPELRRQGG